jgi:hypothetical protein
LQNVKKSFLGEQIDGSPPKTVSTLQFAPQMQQNNALVHGGANFMSINAGYNVAHQSLGQRPVEQIRHVQGAEMAPPPAPVPPQTQYGVRRLSPQPSVIMAQPAMKGANDNLPTAIRGPQFHSKFVTPQATNVPGPGMLHMSIPAQQADQPAVLHMICLFVSPSCFSDIVRSQSRFYPSLMSLILAVTDVLWSHSPVRLYLDETTLLRRSGCVCKSRFR